MTDWDEEEYYTRNAIEGSARLRDAILRKTQSPRDIIWFDPECQAMSRRTISDIQAEVARYFHISPLAMDHTSRFRSAAHPRQIAMYMAREMLGASFPKIGREFGHRDHTTAVYACNAVKKRLASDPACRAAIEAVRERLAA
jgi:chromosomal replication initiator protein